MNKNNDEIVMSPVENEEVVTLDLAEEVYNLRSAIWALVKAIKTSK